MKKILRSLFLLILLLVGIWCAASAPIVLTLPAWAGNLLAGVMVILFIGAFFNRNSALFLAGIELTLLLYFILLTPRQQFKDVEFMRVFAVKPEIKFLPDGRFEVIKLRDNHYRTVSDFDDNFIQRTYDPAKVQELEMAVVYWENMMVAAHIMFNFKFSDGQELTVSVEPRTPVGRSRAPFHCLCKQQELLFVLGTPQDLIDLRVNYRGEDLYLYQMDMSPEQIRIFLDYVIRRTDKLSREPEFYNLISDNCITALMPGLQAACPELKPDMRTLFNGEFPRMLYEQNLLKHRTHESFESLRSRSFRKGISQGKL